ncbi:hypothetical protein EGW08_006299 [Elysia chlorotica]|uniref:Copper transport protein n=1 Tax=Elysia chlorotica TaxID=188477 RepID=A0A433TWE4_ELYCH|nr:hypothetical protein EGW08_006299 [Elysia chlorotica]
MKSFFNTAVDMTNIIFKGWDTSSTRDAVIASFIALIMTMFFEWTKVIKAYIVVRRRQSPLTYGKYHKTEQYGNHQQHGDQGNRVEVQGSYASTAELLSPLKIPASIEQIRKWRITLFILESVMHTFNFFWAYILMLLVMTYSVWFLVAVLIGSGVGYFLFDPVRQMYAEKYLDNKQTECVQISPEPTAPQRAAINSQEETPFHQPARQYDSVSRK